MTHHQWSKKAKPATPCTCHHLTYGGRCLNCGYDPNSLTGRGATILPAKEVVNTKTQMTPAIETILRIQNMTLDCQHELLRLIGFTDKELVDKNLSQNIEEASKQLTAAHASLEKAIMSARLVK